MERKRRNFSAEMKARIALEAIKNQRTIQEIASHYGVHPNQMTRWKRQAIEDFGSVSRWASTGGGVRRCIESRAKRDCLQAGSAAIDAGTAGGTPQTDFEGVPRTFEGVPRTLDGNGDGTPVIDMGAYEAPDFDQMPPVTVAAAAPTSNAARWNTTNVTVTRL